MAVSFPGIGSGLDVNSLLEALRSQLTSKNTITKKKVENLTSQNDALEKLRTKLNALDRTLDPIRTLNGGAGSLKTASSSNSQVATVSAGSGAQSGSYDLTVNSLAKRATGSLNKTFSSANDYLVNEPGASGDVKFKVGTGDDETEFSVAVDETTTASDFVSRFNTAAGGKASASLVKLSDNSYKITFSTNETGTAKGSLSVEVDEELEDLSADVTQASDASFEIAGIGSFTRSSNQISDVLPGVSLSLAATGTTEISIKNDSSAALKKAEEFVNGFNDLVKFVNTEDVVKVQPGKDGSFTNISGSLSSTQVDENAVSALKSAISSARSNDGTLSAAAIGISTQRDGTIAIDKQKFQEAYAANPDGVNQVLTGVADNLAGATGAIQQYTGYQRDIDLAIGNNTRAVQSAQDSISRVEQSAQKQLDSLQRQFTNLDKIVASATQASSVLESILRP